METKETKSKILGRLGGSIFVGRTQIFSFMPVSLTSKKIHLAQEFSCLSSVILLLIVVDVINSDGKASEPSPFKRLRFDGVKPRYRSELT